MIVIVDYGMGNLRSIANMLKKGGSQALISSDPGVVREATKLILPGVGAFDAGMTNLADRRLVEPLNRAVRERKVPVIGLCLGMQLMTRASEEGHLPGLGWFEADTVRFRWSGGSASMKIPHMGWNTTHFVRESEVGRKLDGRARFYFAHSFHVVCERAEDVLGRTTYGYEFASAVERSNIVAVQFHPEKSHRYGMQLLRNFAESGQAESEAAGNSWSG